MKLEIRLPYSSSGKFSDKSQESLRLAIIDLENDLKRTFERVNGNEIYGSKKFLRGNVYENRDVGKYIYQRNKGLFGWLTNEREYYSPDIVANDLASIGLPPGYPHGNGQHPEDKGTIALLGIIPYPTTITVNFVTRETTEKNYLDALLHNEQSYRNLRINRKHNVDVMFFTLENKVLLRRPNEKK